MSVVVRLYNINSPNEFEIWIKKGDSAYPLLSETDYDYYDVYSGGTTQVEITGYTFENNQQYWIRLIDNVVNEIDPKRGFINENLYIDDAMVYDVEVNTLFIYVPTFDPAPTVTPTISITPSITPTPGASVTPTPTITITPSSDSSYLYLGTLGYVTTDLACGFPLSYSYYFNSPTLSLGLICYTDSNLTIPFNGGSLWYKMRLNGTGTEYLVKISTSGVILDISLSGCPCIGDPICVKLGTSNTTICSETPVEAWVVDSGRISVNEPIYEDCYLTTLISSSYTFFVFGTGSGYIYNISNGLLGSPITPNEYCPNFTC